MGHYSMMAAETMAMMAAAQVDEGEVNYGELRHRVMRYDSSMGDGRDLHGGLRTGKSAVRYL